MKKYIKNLLYKKKRQLYNYHKKKLHRVFWENNIDNQYYGHYHILKKYSKTILPYKINGEVQHGWASKSGITSADLNSNDEDIKLKRFYVFSSRNKELANQAGYYNVIPIGAPFIYIRDLYKNLNNFNKKSIIFFPSHSHEWAKFKSPIEAFKKYVEDIKKIESHFKNITVSLSWPEYENIGIRKLFERESICVISMGAKENNPDFLFNFLNHVKKYEYVSSDIFSSSVFYSLIIKRKTFIYGDLISKNKIYKLENKNPAIEIYSHYSKLYPELIWGNFKDTSYPSIGEKELGLRHKKSPKALREIFNWKLEHIF